MNSRICKDDYNYITQWLVK